MRNNTVDQTLKKNYIQVYQYLIKEYEEVKRGEHKHYKLAKDFYKAKQTCAQVFLKYYNRYKLSGGNAEAFLPGKRGPKYQTRRTDGRIELLVIEERKKGLNRYEIHAILREQLSTGVPSPSCIYQIMRRYGMNRLKEPMKEEKKRIIKEKAGELAHIDCHHISRDTIVGDRNKYYLVCVIDSCTRVAWAEVVTDIKALTVMFTTLRCFNHLSSRFGIQFKEALTDNGPEFGPKESKSKSDHPFSRMLMEMGLKHRHTRPYRPQTNGKVERFWRTLNEDLIDGTTFESLEHFTDELFKYLVYYNRLRHHQGIGGITPEKCLQNLNCSNTVAEKVN